MKNSNQKNAKEKVLLKPKYDVVFQTLFSDKNKKETGYLISAILGKKINVLKVNTELSEFRELPQEKVGRLDLVAQTQDNEIVHIELQLVNYFNTIPRLIYSLGKLISKQLSRGENYSNLKRTITIGLLDYTLPELYDINKMHTVWTFHEEEVVEKKLTNLQELHIIEMPKAKKEYKNNPSNILTQWIMFILNPNEMEVKSIMKNNDEINETNEKLENISGDKHLKKRAEILERWELEEKWNKQSVFSHGVEEGSMQKVLEVAKAMLKENLPLDTICKVTGLSVEEVKKLNQN